MSQERKKTLASIALVALLIAAGYVLFDRGMLSALPKNPAIEADGDERDDATGDTKDEEELVEDESDNYDISLYLPSARRVGAPAVRTFMTEYADDFRARANDEMPQIRALDSSIQKYSLDIRANVYETDAHISYALVIGEYTGGANVNAMVESFVYDKKSGERRVLTDIVPENRRDAFMATVRKELFTANGMPLDSKDMFADSIRALSFADLRHFYIEEGVVTVLFSKYEVAPGAAGIVSVRVAL